MHEWLLGNWRTWKDEVVVGNGLLWGFRSTVHQTNLVILVAYVYGVSSVKNVLELCWCSHNSCVCSGNHDHSLNGRITWHVDSSSIQLMYIKLFTIK